MKISQIRERAFAVPSTSCPATTTEAVVNVQAQAPAGIRRTRPIFSLLTQPPRALVIAAFYLCATTMAGGEPIRTDGATFAPAKVAFGLTPPAADSLPELGGSDSDTLNARSTAAAPGFSHAVVAENPQAPDATAVGEKVCLACHRLENEHFSGTVHASGLRAAAAGRPEAPVCEACHGPGSAHAKRPTDKGLIIAFTHDSGTPIAVQTKTCLTCHKGGPRDHWLGSVHQRNDLSCSDCHNPMQKVSVEGLLAKNSINEVCATCHNDIRVQFNRRSHMPLPEGQLACVDCHNPHGSTTAPLLKTDTVNETCYQCHAEKRGPFLFEHAPVRESCLNCHTPHGSNQVSLLVAPIPFLCQQCHTQLRHPNDLQTAQSLGSGLHPDERIMGRGCITCHAQIHGSNHPSGPRFHE